MANQFGRNKKNDIYDTEKDIAVRLGKPASQICNNIKYMADKGYLMKRYRDKSSEQI